MHCSLIRGQYGPGKVDGESVPGYRQEEGVASDSDTETFVALRTYIDNWRWEGVPVYLATGKRLPDRLTEIAVEFMDVPNVLFGKMEEVRLQTNLLKIRVQPDEGVSLRILTKTPGLKLDIREAEMDFPYASTFLSNSPEAYERLLLDVMSGNSTLFARRDEIELAWQFVEPILEYWESGVPPEFPNYAAGTWGPIHGADFFREDVCYSQVPRRSGTGSQ
jgi:glucose-6-phosphate 1-dehydrogenase